MNCNKVLTDPIYMKFISIILWVSLGELVAFFFFWGGRGEGGCKREQTKKKSDVTDSTQNIRINSDSTGLVDF
jgi:hypothetical protein